MMANTVKGILFLFGIAVFVAAACGNGQKKEVTMAGNDPLSNEMSLWGLETYDRSATTDRPAVVTATLDYDVSIRQIDSAVFDSVSRVAGKQTPGYIRKVDNIAQATELLAGRVSFGEHGTIAAIRFRNGKAYGTRPEEKILMEESVFVAFYPDEDILLLEAGHQTDVSFNLTTGAETGQVGNPEYTYYSQHSKFRVIGIYGGQECFDYILQVRTAEGQYTALEDLQASEAIPFPCVIKRAVWLGDERWFYVATDDTTGEEIYHEMRITLG